MRIVLPGLALGVLLAAVCGTQAHAETSVVDRITVDAVQDRKDNTNWTFNIQVTAKKPGALALGLADRPSRLDARRAQALISFPEGTSTVTIHISQVTGKTVMERFIRPGGAEGMEKSILSLDPSFKDRGVLWLNYDSAKQSGESAVPFTSPDAVLTNLPPPHLGGGWSGQAEVPRGDAHILGSWVAFEHGHAPVVFNTAGVPTFDSDAPGAVEHRLPINKRQVATLVLWVCVRDMPPNR